MIGETSVMEGATARLESLAMMDKATARLDLIRNVDLCPFVASQKTMYDDGAVLDIVSANPEVCR